MSFRTILQLGIFSVIFAYVALGPYQAYYHQVTDQAKAPVELAYRSISNAVSDIALLVTNPTEWYAKQQVVNVRPERPIDYPKGIELVSLDALPNSVPGGQPFAIKAVIRNAGTIEAQDITLAFGCNQWCDIIATYPTPSVAPNIFSGSDYDVARQRLGTSVSKAIQNREMFYIKDKMKRGDAEIITVTPFTANIFESREAETRFAKVTLNISYAYSTNSSLLVSVISDSELNRRFVEGETVFQPVTAVAKSSPAQLSLNVGPQPLKEGTDTILLISVSNTRDQSKVVLPFNTEIIIRASHSIAQPDTLRCDEYRTIKADNRVYGSLYREGYDTVVYRARPTQEEGNIEILANQFNSIFAFLCNFNAANNIDTTRSGLITAELPRYIFRLEQKKDISITAPLGILFEPYESVCNRCGGAMLDLNRCDADECHQLSDSGKGTGATCYIEYATTPNTCHVCGREPDCSKFISQQTCTAEDSICSSECAWNPDYTHPISGARIGICYTVVNDVISAPFTPFTGEIAERIIRQARVMNFSKDSAERILKLAKQESGIRQCTDGTLNCGDSSRNAVLLGDNGDSAGIFQLNRKAHPSWYTNQNGCNGQMPYDVDCNIFLGVGYIANLYNDSFTDPPKRYNCLGTSYSGWNAIYRYYNGWPAYSCKGTPNYVSGVNGQDVSQFRPLIDSIYSEPSPTTLAGTTTTTTGSTTGQSTQTTSLLGAADYCIKKARGEIPGVSRDECVEGEGGCTASILCKDIFNQAGEKLACRRIIANGVCCFPSDTDDQCRQKFVARTTASLRGSSDYCAKKLAGQISGVDAGPCREGEGGCTTTTQCENIAAEPNPPQGLACRTNLSSAMCCFPTDSDVQCLQRFNAWRSG